jgi:hypothetical protein
MRHFSRLSLMAALGTALITPAFAQGTNQAAAPASPAHPNRAAAAAPASPGQPLRPAAATPANPAASGAQAQGQVQGQANRAAPAAPATPATPARPLRPAN